MGPGSTLLRPGSSYNLSWRTQVPVKLRQRQVPVQILHPLDPLRKDSELWVPAGNPTNQLREPRVAGRRRGRGRGAGLPFLRGAPAAGAAQLRAALRRRGADHHHLRTLLLLLLLDIMSESEIEIESDRTPTNDDEIECEGESKQQHKRKTARRQGPVGQWDIICEKVSEEDINSRLQSTARVELGGSTNWSGATWKPPVAGTSKVFVVEFTTARLGELPTRRAQLSCV